jgi:hypothetical protein
MDNTGCLFKKDRSHFLPAADFSWLNGHFKPKGHIARLLSP